MPRLDASGTMESICFRYFSVMPMRWPAARLKMRWAHDYSVPMSKGRLEAFSDGVFAVIITIMVLELKAPHSGDLEAVQPLLPSFLTYVLSYIFVGIYWNNHHHLMHVIDR